MALPNTIQDRDFNNFVEVDGKPHRLISGSITADVVLGTLLDGITFDSIFASYPSATVEVYEYKQLGVTSATVTVTYTNATKKYLSSVVRS